MNAAVLACTHLEMRFFCLAGMKRNQGYCIYNKTLISFTTLVNYHYYETEDCRRKCCHNPTKFCLAFTVRGTGHGLLSIVHVTVRHKSFITGVIKIILSIDPTGITHHNEGSTTDLLSADPVFWIQSDSSTLNSCSLAQLVIEDFLPLSR